MIYPKYINVVEYLSSPRDGFCCHFISRKIMLSSNNMVQNSISRLWYVLRSIIVECPIFIKIQLVWLDISTWAFWTCQFGFVSWVYLCLEDPPLAPSMFHSSVSLSPYWHCWTRTRRTRPRKAKPSRTRRQLRVNEVNTSLVYPTTVAMGS